MQPSLLKTLLLALLLACVIANPAVASEKRLISVDSEGFCTSLPYIGKQTLTQRIETSRRLLREKQSVLKERVRKQRFSGLDTLITVAMPGGLLYAAVKHNSQLEERKALREVTQEISRLSGDLLTFQSAASSLQIASLQ